VLNVTRDALLLLAFPLDIQRQCVVHASSGSWEIRLGLYKLKIIDIASRSKTQVKPVSGNCKKGHSIHEMTLQPVSKICSAFFILARSSGRVFFAFVH
jgi:hypothetical protein